MTSINENRPDAVLVRGSAAEVVHDGPHSLIALLADSNATGGALTSNLATLRPGSAGAPPHYHTRATELFYVLDGSMDVLLGEQIVVLSKGDFLTVPPRLAHAFAPSSGAECEVLVVFAPGMERFEYYRLLQRVYRGESDAAEIAASSERFDNHYVDSPIWAAARG